MLFHKPMDQTTASSLLQNISLYTQQILLNPSKKVPYQLAYDYIYQLCHHQKQQLVLETICSSIKKSLPEVFQKLSLQSQHLINDFTVMISSTQQNLKKIEGFSLKLDKTYCELNLNCKLINIINQLLLQQFFSRKQLLQQLGKQIAMYHLSNNQISLEPFVKAIKQIDYEEEYFLKHFVEYYVPVLVQNFARQGEKRFTQFNQASKIQHYLEYAHEMLQRQQSFLKKFWPDKKCQPNKQFIVRQLYSQLVTRFKSQIYSTHSQKLFNCLTLEILELFKYNPKSNDIQKHAEWYNTQIKLTLQKIKQQNNTLFVQGICQFYNKIMGLLQKTHGKFDIHYRSRFAFEQWINEQKLQMPLRLNEYIRVYCLNQENTQSQSKHSQQQNDKRILHNIGIIFVLMKEKNLFEKNYRRELVQRMLEKYDNYDMARERKVIAMMEKQCSEQFVKNILPIVECYLQIAKKQSHNHSHLNKLHNQLNVLPLPSDNWPYDQKHITSITINPQLLKLTTSYTLKFNQQHKDKSLYFHPIIGVVKMKISFLQSTKWQGQLIVNTCMANLLLNFIKTSYEPFLLKTFCAESGYMLDHVYESLKRLLFSKVLVNQGSEDNYLLAINETFSHSSPSLNIIQIEPTDKFQSKPLQQLKADRKFMVEAIIVKIMKRLKTTDKQSILKETAPMIQKRGFSFNAKFVEGAIDRLVDKQFIRDYQDGKYGYIA